MQNQEKLTKNVVKDKVLGDLPGWDLADLYDSIDSPQIETDLTDMQKAADAFAKNYQGKLADLDGDKLAAALAEYERIDEVLSKLMSYAQLVHAENMADPKLGQFYQKMQERVTDISSTLLFFTLELNKISDDILADQLASAALQKYKPWIDDIRVFKDHQLADEMERLLHEKRVSGRSAWMRLFDETFAHLKFPHKGKDLSSTEILDKLSDPDRSIREAAAHDFSAVLEQNIQLFGLITNTLAKDKATEDKWRNYKKPISSRNLVNQVEDEVVEALVNAVRTSYPKLSHRYYQMKAKWMGLEKLEYWDRNAPLPDEDDTRIPYTQATATVYDAYKEFSVELADVGRKFFDNPWIDVPVRPGKSPGAFAHPVVPSAHPYLLLNYQGRKRDVMTLAHELGHGVHQLLAGDAQGHFLSDTPLTLAETASVFGEMLTFQKLLNVETDQTRKKVMLAGKVEDMLNTVVRQIAFHTFEAAIHDKRKDGELTTEEINAIWMEIQTESLGPAFTFADEYKHFWAYIPHFIHSPFYVYAYAFGDCLVNSLYAVYQKSADGFSEKYLDMLRAGGSKRHKELLAPFGLDASDPAFWQQGLNMISGFIDELEAME